MNSFQASARCITLRLYMSRQPCYEQEGLFATEASHPAPLSRAQDFADEYAEGFAD
jgi:hypothetical protein